MEILVVGASGGSGKAAVEHLLSAGHRVTAFVRRPDSLDIRSDRLRLEIGDATEPRAIERAVRGHDAVIVTLGITENPLRVRVFGPARTPLDVRSIGTRHVIRAMKEHGVRRLVVQTSYGVGSTRAALGWLDSLFFSLILKPQIADTELQQRAVERSGLDWLLVQPVHLTDAVDSVRVFVSRDGSTGTMKVSRKAVGRVLALAATDEQLVRETLCVSGVDESRSRPSAADPNRPAW